MQHSGCSDSVKTNKIMILLRSAQKAQVNHKEKSKEKSYQNMPYSPTIFLFYCPMTSGVLMSKMMSV